MATSSSYNFSTTRDTIINDALLYIGAVGEGETPAAAAVTESARMLNMLMKSWAGDGMPLWSLKRGYILPFTEESSISTSSHVVTNYDSTTISADEASGQTTLSVTTSTNMAASDQIGIEMDDGTMHWTTISSVPDSTSVIIATAIDDTAAAGNYVYWYTASADRIPVRPLRVTDANILKTSDNSSWEITVDERTDYYNLGNRTTEGTPNRIYYNPILGTRAADPTSSSTWYGEFFVYPRFNSGDYVIEFTYHEPMQDFDASTDNPYWPQEFYLPLMMELSALLGPRYGMPIEERKAMFAEAELYRLAALDSIYEEGSVFIQPEDENA